MNAVGRLRGQFRRLGFERARRGQFTWTQGPIAGLTVQTPCFMPVGTQGSVRAQRMQDVASLPAPIILGNTFHLMRNPGLETLGALGGLKRLNGWKRALLTDSGGYQVFSLAHHAKLDERGVRFQYGQREKEIFLSPETSVAAQQVIGSDIMMVFDQCIPSTADLGASRAAMELTHRWAKRSVAARSAEYPGALFGIVQGACHTELRRESAQILAGLTLEAGYPAGLDGLAIGGLAVGESKDERESTTAFTEQFLPEQMPRYLMGVGTPIDLLEAVARGMDLFDCVMPTLYAQQGVAFTWRGRIDLRRGIYRLDQKPLDPDCPCPTCATHSRAYLRHLIRAREVSGWSAIGQHNLYFYTHFMEAMCSAMDAGNFADFYHRQRDRVAFADLENPVNAPIKKPNGAAARRTPRYRLVLGPEGDGKVVHVASGEWMHARGDSVKEARALYVLQSDWMERALCQSSLGHPWVLWDVGLGAATNAMVALQEWKARRSAASQAELLICSFENDLEPLRLAIQGTRSGEFPFPSLDLEIAEALLERGVWENAECGVRWELYRGDFQKRATHAPAPDTVFYDPFSFKVDAPLWSEEFLRELRAQLIDSPRPSEWMTYSRSNQLRGRLLRAGFYVTRGVGLNDAQGRPIKEETTRFFSSADAAAATGRVWLPTAAR